MRAAFALGDGFRSRATVLQGDYFRGNCLGHLRLLIVSAAGFSRSTSPAVAGGFASPVVPLDRILAAILAPSRATLAGGLAIASLRTLLYLLVSTSTSWALTVGLAVS
jgi:hypothetical protein